MRKLLVGLMLALLLAVFAAVYAVIYVPGCGWVDPWIYIVYGCEAAGGGGSGAGL